MLVAAGVPVVIAAVLSTLESFGLHVVLFGLFCVALLLVWLGTTLVRMARALAARRWFDAAGPLLVLLMFWPLIGAGVLSGRYIHLAAMYPSYRNDVGAVRAPCGQDIRFPWGDHAQSAMDGIHFETLIYHCTRAALVDQLQDSGVSDRLNTRNEHLIGPWYLEHATTD